jgi:[ribosomal protein S5]-alanine N-acetyltransferase
MSSVTMASALAADAPLPALHTDRLVLRPFEAGDAAQVEALAGAREVADTTLTIPHPYPKGGATMWIATHGAAWTARTQATYAIVDRGTDALRGAAGIALSMPNSRGELGYWIGVPYWNRGYCTEAVGALMAFGFQSLGLHRLEARHFIRNPASGRVMQKLGMTLEGIHREAYLRWDRFEDVAMYGILRDEWNALNEQNEQGGRSPTTAA